MKKIYIMCLILMIILMIACKDNKSLMTNRINDGNNDLTIIKHDIEIIDKERVIKDKVMMNFVYDDIEYISLYKNNISGYSKKNNEIVITDTYGALLDKRSIDVEYKISYLAQIDSENFIVSDFKRTNKGEQTDIYLLSNDKSEKIFDWEKNNGEDFNYIVKKILKHDDTILLLDSNNKLFSINDNQVKIFKTDEAPYDICINAGKLYVLTENTIDIFDIKNSKLYEQIYLNDITTSYISINEDGKLSILGNEFLYLQKDSDQFEKISILSNIASSKILSYSIIGSDLVLLSHLGINKYSIKNKNEMVELNDEQTVTIGTYDKITFISEIIGNLDFGEIKVNTVYYRDLSYENYITKLTSDFLTQNAPDVMLFFQNDNVLDFIRSGSILDMKPLIDKDKEFDLELFEKNIIKDSITNDKMYYFISTPNPFYIEYNASLLNKLGYKDLNNLDLNDLYELYITVNSDLSNPDYNIGYNGEGLKDLLARVYYTLFANDINKFIKYEEKSSTFNSIEFSEMIKKAKVIYNGYLNSPISLIDIGDDLLEKNQITSLGNHMFYTFSLQNGYNYLEIYDDSIIMPTPKGFISKSRPLLGGTTLICINKDSKNLELAWKAVKKLVSYEAEYYLGFPFNLDSKMDPTRFGVLIESNDEKIDNLRKYKSSFQSQEQTDLEILVLDNILTTNYEVILKSKFDDIIIKELNRYFKNEITVKEVSEILQNKAKLYLGE